MTPQTGQISLGDLRTEIGATGPISLGSTTVRNYLFKSSGAVSLDDAHGVINYTVTANSNAFPISGVATSQGMSTSYPCKFTLNINSGVSMLYRVFTGTLGSNSRIRINNAGIIYGKGGRTNIFNGGEGGSLFNPYGVGNGYAGEAGTGGIQHQSDSTVLLYINNTGTMYAGSGQGGGGGAAGYTSSGWTAAGGGGGGGAADGYAGAGGQAFTRNGSAGFSASPTATTGANGGPGGNYINYVRGGAGGAGGSLGGAGAAGVQGSGYYANSISSGGAGGAAGVAVTAPSGTVVWENYGTLYGNAGP